MEVNVANSYFKRNKSEYLSGKKDYKPKGMSKLGPSEIARQEAGGPPRIDTPAKSVKPESRRNSGAGQKKNAGKGKKKLASKRAVVARQKTK